MAIVIGSGDNRYTYNPDNPSDTSIPAPDKSDSGSKSSNQGSGNKKQTFKSKFVYGGSKGVDESVDKKDKKYNVEGEHKLSSQFRYLADKYYGGDQEALAKTSQGQVLLGYLQNVPYTRGGGLGLLDEDMQKQLGLLDLDVVSNLEDMDDPNLLKTKNMPISFIRNDPSRGFTGPFNSEQFKKFNEFLYASRPELYGQARPFSSGRALPNLIRAGVNPLGVMATSAANTILNQLGKDPIEMSKPFRGIAEGNEYTEGILSGEIQPLNPNLFANLPIDERVDSGGVNEVAQFIINNQMQQEEEDEFDTAQFDPDSFIQGFGFPFVDPSLFNLDGTGVTGLEV
tara:strand:+ start:216 stop:1238 length:1023 start_codon:yes stop_codon:yes gene_type:complete